MECISRLAVLEAGLRSPRSRFRMGCPGTFQMNLTAALAQGPSILPKTVHGGGRQAWERRAKSGKTQLGWESTQTSLVLSYPQGRVGSCIGPTWWGGGASWPEHRIGGQEAGQSGQLPSRFFPPFSFSPPLPAPLTSPHVFPILPSSLFPFPSPPSSPLLSSGSTKPMSSKSQLRGPERPQVFLQRSRGSSTLSRLQPFPRLRRPDPLLKGQLYPTHLSMVSILLA